MQDNALQQARIYTDFNGLNALKARAREDNQSALDNVARQFESLFLAEMLKSMRKAGDALAEGNDLKSHQSGLYRDLFDSQISLTMAGGKGSGLADALARQLARQVSGMGGKGDTFADQKIRIADYDRRVPALSAQLPERAQKVTSLARTMPSAGSFTSSDLPHRFESPEQFVSGLLPVAEQTARDSGIDPKLLIAQAALETGWGRYMIRGEQGRPSFNLFGIKADSRWQGDAVAITTTEYRDGMPMKEQASFRAYRNYQASFRDYVAFLESNPRYRDVLAVADQPDLFAEKLQEAGYATDPNYGHKIRQIMNRDSLMTLPAGGDDIKE